MSPTRRDARLQHRFEGHQLDILAHRRRLHEPAIAGMFLGAFLLIELANGFLPLVAGILIAGTIWSWVVFRAVRRNEAKIKNESPVGNRRSPRSCCSAGSFRLRVGAG